MAALLDRLLRRQLDVFASPDDRDDDRLSLARPERFRDLLERLRRLHVHRHDLVARPQSRLRRRRIRGDFVDPPRGAVRDSEHVDDREQQDREDHVRERSGRDHRDALPRRLAPVRLGTERIAELFTAAAGGSGGHRRQLRLRQRFVEAPKSCAGLGEVTLRDEALQALHRADERRGLEKRGAEMMVQVGRRRPVHPGNLHVATERNGSDSVLDSVPRRLRQRGRKADVEPPRSHPDGARREEVTGLVDHHEEAEPDDCDQDAHGRASSRVRTRSHSNSRV